MTAKELKKLLETVPDNAKIVINGMDHNYIVAHCSLTTALGDDGYLWVAICQDGSMTHMSDIH